MRHGLACQRGVTDDFQKPLSALGQKEVQAQTDRFRQPDGIRPDCIFCSTAVRARQTVELLSELFIGTPIFFRESLYLAPAFRVLDLIRETDSLFHRIMVVGHNPGLEQLIPLLSASTITNFLSKCKSFYYVVTLKFNLQRKSFLF